MTSLEFWTRERKRSALWLGALALVEIEGKLGAFECHRDLRGKDLQAFSGAPRNLFPRMDREGAPRHPLGRKRDDRQHALAFDSGGAVVEHQLRKRACSGHHAIVSVFDCQTNRRPIGIHDLEGGVDRDSMDVVGSPRDDERRRSLCQRVLAPLRAGMPRDQPGQADDHEPGQCRRGPDDDQELAAPVA